MTATPAAHGTAALVLHQARFDLRGFLRNRQAPLLHARLPLIFLVIFIGVFGKDTVGAVRAEGCRRTTCPGISALAVIAASFINLVISITVQREAGVLKRRRATPVPASVLIGGRTLTAIVVAAGRR